MIPPAVFSTKAAARYLGVSPQSLARWRITGQGPHFVKAGRRVVYLRADLDRWLLSRRRLSTSEGPPDGAIR
ncbi:MAG: helix-turn-helix domain-containing protein [Proteobacteria bacterium]|nr:helix-turn-helix domain-containing protein [Pseudomonadota bacterium]MBU1741745.1 helix-turn-helix domain-containing protein [Pseudomonadota bacterium]